MPLFSIIIPFYNTEPEFYKKTFSCLANLPTGLVEILVVDDGSAAEAHDALATYLKCTLPEALLYRKENGGQNSARQYGLDKAKGEYVFFLDSDDYLDIAEFLRLSDYLKTNKPDVVAYNFNRVAPDGKLLGCDKPWDEGFRQVSLPRLAVVSDSLWRQCYRLQRIKSLPFGLVQGIRIGEDFASSLSFNLSLRDIVAYGGYVYQYVQRDSSIIHEPPLSALDDIQIAFEQLAKRVGPTYSGCKTEVEWLAVLHALYWNSMRVINVVGVDKARQHAMRAWMEQLFPDWRKNPYLAVEPITKKLIFKLLVSGRWREYAFLSGCKKVLYGVAGKLKHIACGR